ncbi:hypothetical protein B446_25020 [Streptomyces collinus Tu 365]|uniref:Uncharacterized protein n=1 Tax=Streptomyces collinus (strain DSM 40733 / Tue 365) TaxID=1214242 RepID=S5VV76_STRC3|nr:hypothetical protein B446_25020 [Streptomyces collinus Tu 365]
MASTPNKACEAPEFTKIVTSRFSPLPSTWTLLTAGFRHLRRAATGPLAQRERGLFVECGFFAGDGFTEGARVVATAVGLVLGLVATGVPARPAAHPASRVTSSTIGAQ